MPFSSRALTQPGVTGRDATIVVLEDGAGGRAEIWPALGFNCYRWQVQRENQTLDLLYSTPDLFTHGRGTRSGIPILFPFPNRIRDGHFTWAGRDFQLPLNGPAQKNAIHGFACYRPWRVVGQGANAFEAWVTGIFRGSVDAPDCREFWPTDYEIRVTYRLGTHSLCIEAEVTNPDSKSMPFGLGYHPYFRLPFTPEMGTAECEVVVPARSFWVLKEALPTGERCPVDAAHDLNQPRSFGLLQVDDILTDLPALQKPGEMGERAEIVGARGSPLRLFCSDVFRELVIFTPPHREAFCVEPYTCTTDAINLQQRGIEAGWRTLQAGERWSAEVVMRV